MTRDDSAVHMERLTVPNHQQTERFLFLSVRKELTDGLIPLNSHQPVFLCPVYIVRGRTDFHTQNNATGVTVT